MAAVLDPENNEIRRWVRTDGERIAENSGTVSLDDSEYSGGKAMSARVRADLIKNEDSAEVRGWIEKATEGRARVTSALRLTCMTRLYGPGPNAAPHIIVRGCSTNRWGATIGIPYLERALQDNDYAMSACYVLGQCYAAQRAYTKAAVSDSAH